MASRLPDLFNDPALLDKIQRRLPDLFHYAERDSSRAGRVGMEVGSFRERILVAMLIHKFGPANVETDLPITVHDVDARLFGEPISIKTLTTKAATMGPVKAIWTVDARKARQFARSFTPTSDYLVAHLVWGHQGGLYYVPVEAQRAVFATLGRRGYLKLPKAGTNPRGVEISSAAMSRLAGHPDTLQIPIRWVRPTTPYDPFDRWVEYWRLG